MVNVPPCTSSGFSFLLRARSPRSLMARCSPTKLRSSAFLTTGTISPQSRATAMPRFIGRVVANVVAFHGGVDDRPLAQSVHRGAREERGEGRAWQPVACSNLPFIFSRSFTMRVTSTSKTPCTCALVRFDSSMSLGDLLAHGGHGHNFAGRDASHGLQRSGDRGNRRRIVAESAAG